MEYYVESGIYWANTGERFQARRPSHSGWYYDVRVLKTTLHVGPFATRDECEKSYQHDTGGVTLEPL